MPTGLHATRLGCAATLLTASAAVLTTTASAAQSSLDVGVRRTIPKPVTVGRGYQCRLPGQTGLVVGLATRLGRMR